MGKDIFLVGRWLCEAIKCEGYLGRIIMYCLTEEHMTLNPSQDEACAVAQAHFNAHVAQEHIYAIYLEMQLIWRHAWWNQSAETPLGPPWDGCIAPPQESPHCIA